MIEENKIIYYLLMLRHYFAALYNLPFNKPNLVYTHHISPNPR